MTSTDQHLTEAADASTGQRVRLQPPSPALMRVLNVIVRRVLANRVLGRRMKRQALLEFDGRRTGRHRRVPVCMHMLDGRAIVMTRRPWRWNFVEGAPVAVTRRGQRRDGFAQLLDASPREIGETVRAALDGGATAFDLGLKIPRGYQATVEDLGALPLGLIHIDFREA
jgi:hypothetical protein